MWETDYGKARVKTDHSSNYYKNPGERGAWLAQSVKRLTLGFGSGHDLRVVGLSLTMGSVLSGESAEDSFPLPLPPCSYMLSCSLSFSNKSLKKKNPGEE